MQKKIKLFSEVNYVLAIIVMSFSVAMLSAADFGLSMIVAPAYILSLKLGFITFGQAEYIIQGVLFIIFCICMKRFKGVYLVAFLSCLIYGACLDLWRTLIPAFNPAVTMPGSMQLWVRIVYFVIGVLLTSFAVALSFKTYIYPQVYDYFVQGLTERYNIRLTKFKLVFDYSFLAISVALSLLFFGEFVGVNWGTLVMAIVNGFIIGGISSFYDKHFETKPIFKKFSNLFGY